MSLLRLFVAMELPSTLQDTIENQTIALREALDATLVRWVPPHNVHLTLKFLGGVSPAGVEFLTQMLRQEVSPYPRFSLRASKLGCFPNTRRPRVIWVGLETPPWLESLQHGIEAAAARLGYGTEERKFAPHLTIGRVRQNLSATGMQSVREALERTHVGEFGTARVDAVHLFRSDLGPDGAVYTSLFSAPLSAE